MIKQGHKMYRTADIYIYGETFCMSTNSWSNENEKYLYEQLGLLTKGFLNVHLGVTPDIHGEIYLQTMSERKTLYKKQYSNGT